MILKYAPRLLRDNDLTMARFHEQREFERVKTNTAISLFYGTPQKSCEALCCDVSEKGMGINSDRVIPMGTECCIKIHDGRTNKKEYQALIEITRVHELEDGRYHLGSIILEKY